MTKNVLHFSMMFTPFASFSLRRADWLWTTLKIKAKKSERLKVKIRWWVRFLSPRPDSLINWQQVKAAASQHWTTGGIISILLSVHFPVASNGSLQARNNKNKLSHQMSPQSDPLIDCTGHALIKASNGRGGKTVEIIGNYGNEGGEFSQCQAQFFPKCL